MTTERTDGPTPGGGAYSITAWVDSKTMASVDKDAADMAIVSEYHADGTFIREQTIHLKPVG